MTTDGTKQLKCHAIPPGEVLVQKFTESRAPELDSLCSTVASRLNDDFRSQRNKRRRTTGFDNRASKTRFRNNNKKQKVGILNQAKSDESLEKNVNRAPPRHIRRKKELNKNLETGFCVSGDGTKRLRMHVWHAKRFTMTKRWGFHLPLGLHGSGKGSRALLKWIKNGTLVHDASYYNAVQLQGSQDSLLSILSTIMSPFSSSDTENVLSGGVYSSSMLHHAGANSSRTIAPVIYMWRPVQQSTNAESVCDRTSELRQLWIWIHAAALTEGYNALKSVCESQGKVRCISLEGQFGTLEVMGSKASQLFQKILHPVSSTSEKSSFLKKCSSVEAVDEHTPCFGIAPLIVKDPRGLTNENTEFDQSCTDLWDAEKGLYCPLEESVLCMEKHHQRLVSFCLADTHSVVVNASTGIHSSRVCPIMLLRRNNLMDSVTRWTIVLPLSWVKAFWVPFVSLGARAIGLRERSWVACEAGIPNFPSEFPECDSYSSLMEAEAAAMDKEAALRPASVKPFSNPIPPPWNCVRLAFETSQICSNESDAVAELALSDNDTAIARSSRMLSGFLNTINGDRLPIFPHFSDKNTCLSKIMKDEKILDHDLNIDSFLGNRCRKVCFVRVILRTFKEGAIEDGAVICAPRLDDIKLWISGSNGKCELQVPQSSVSSYFVKRDSGKWEYQLPEDPAVVESNRWPIGFVTSGFVHGSHKPSAGGLCDAMLLGRLRHEQWSSVPLKQRKKEIYVLTRNLRSTAYRLAVATIFLEHHQEDFDYI
ncbi:ribonucleases P/MRP protein subunit POP1-like isoform X2 [Bidens hawaiensis]|uniref:ribonucleases P/MRP protein subunit POP1-like isoform X2 n=1 Tax=Bidens hawaiensis TaxID=980011 RepID=UPI00404947B6